MLLLGPDGGPLAGDGLETGLDGLHRARGMTRHTLNAHKGKQKQVVVYSPENKNVD